MDWSKTMKVGDYVKAKEDIESFFRNESIKIIEEGTVGLVTWVTRDIDYINVNWVMKGGIEMPIAVKEDGKLKIISKNEYVSTRVLELLGE